MDGLVSKQALDELQKAKEAHEAAKKACEDADNAIRETYRKLGCDIAKAMSTLSRKSSTTSLHHSVPDHYYEPPLSPALFFDPQCGETAAKQAAQALAETDKSSGQQIQPGPVEIDPLRNLSESNDSQAGSGQNSAWYHFSSGEDPRLAPFVPRFH